MTTITKLSIFGRQSFTLLSLALLLSGCATLDQLTSTVTNNISSPDPVTGERQISLTSEDQEISQAGSFTDQILQERRDKGEKLDKDLPHYTEVARVFNQLTKVAPRQQLPWEIHLLDDPAWNAFTIGGGKVFVYSGIFNGDAAISGDDEIAAILAHEIAHVAARHPTEKADKLKIIRSVDHGLKSDSQFTASFTTIQEEEADKYSVLYMALAGYDPRASARVWSRMQEVGGSYVGNMLYDHPLNDDREKAVAKYAELAMQYYSPGVINPDYEEILKNNAIYSYKDASKSETGKGSGFASLLDLAANTYMERTTAKNEELKRKLKSLQQQNEATQKVLILGVKIPFSLNGKRLHFTVMNATDSTIATTTLLLEYKIGTAVMDKEEITMPALPPYARKEMIWPLKQITYNSVSVRPIYVQVQEVSEQLPQTFH